MIRRRRGNVVTTTVTCQPRSFRRITARCVTAAVARTFTSHPCSFSLRTVSALTSLACPFLVLYRCRFYFLLVFSAVRPPPRFECYTPGTAQSTSTMSSEYFRKTDVVSVAHPVHVFCKFHFACRRRRHELDFIVCGKRPARVYAIEAPDLRGRRRRRVAPVGPRRVHVFYTPSSDRFRRPLYHPLITVRGVNGCSHDKAAVCPSPTTAGPFAVFERVPFRGRSSLLILRGVDLLYKPMCRCPPCTQSDCSTLLALNVALLLLEYTLYFCANRGCRPLVFFLNRVIGPGSGWSMNMYMIGRRIQCPPRITLSYSIISSIIILLLLSPTTTQSLCLSN